MRKVFETRARLVALGLAGALILALALVLLGSGSARAQTVTPTPTPTPPPAVTVQLRHVNPDGSDYTGNPLCPQTVWSADGKAKVVAVDPRHDCNNIASQRHIIRTEGYDDMIGRAGLLSLGFNHEGVGAIVVQGPCGLIGDFVSRPLYGNIDDDEDTLVDEDPVNQLDDDDDTLTDEDPAGDPARDLEMCVVIHSKDPGETRVTFTYLPGEGLPTATTDAVFKEWDKMIDTVILKAADVEAVAGWAASKWPGRRRTEPRRRR
jgi:hypothetical protein